MSETKSPPRPPRRRAPLSLLLLAVLAGLLLAAPPPAAARPECVWTGVQRIVAIGDLHGDYYHFFQLLQWADLVDSDGHWTGGKSHLVQMGDVMDRGKRAKEIFGLIKKLEKEAAAAGGMVHMLLGNHEEMNLMQRSTQFEDYVTPEQFKDFLSREIIAAEEKKAGGSVSDDRWKELIRDQESEAVADYYRNFTELYGPWLAEHNVVIKINDTVFVHGGLTESWATRGLETINNLYRSEMQRYLRDHQQYFPPRILFQPSGPLWDRSLADPDSGQDYEARVDRILKLIGAQRVVVAHTPSHFRGREDDMKRYDGKVWVIDTGISSPNGRVWGLRIENGSASVIRRD